MALSEWVTRRGEPGELVPQKEAASDPTESPFLLPQHTEQWFVKSVQLAAPRWQCEHVAAASTHCSPGTASFSQGTRGKSPEL